MNLKGLVHRELGEGLNEKELAAAIGVSPRTIMNIMADRVPKETAVWKKFATYFRMDADFLRTGRLVGARASRRKGAVAMRRVPLLSWAQIYRTDESMDLSRITDPEAVLETTGIAGLRTFALQVKDDSMSPLFGKGEIIFVNPQLKGEPGHYVVAGLRQSPESAMLRQLKRIGNQHVLHPLNRRYQEVPMTNAHRVWGKVIRLRKNL